jgi:hypothetical protein
LFSLERNSLSTSVFAHTFPNNLTRTSSRSRHSMTHTRSYSNEFSRVDLGYHPLYRLAATIMKFSFRSIEKYQDIAFQSRAKKDRVKRLLNSQLICYDSTTDFKQFLFHIDFHSTCPTSSIFLTDRIHERGSQA